MFSTRFKFLSFGLIGCCCLAPGVFAEPFETFTIDKISGNVCEVRSSGEPGWKPAVKGAVEKSGTSGRTGAESMFTVAFDENNRFRLLPKTEVEIRTTSMSGGFRKVVDLKLTKGKVDAQLDKFPENHQFKVQTPTAVCGAVGTQFEVEYDGGLQNTFQCDKGTIFAESTQDGSFKIPKIQKGQSLSATVEPGKENSYARLTAKGGSLEAAFGSEKNQFEIPSDKAVRVAQERDSGADQVAVKVHGGKGYILDGGEAHDVSGDAKLSKLLSEYLDLAENEGEAKLMLEKAKAQGLTGGEIEQLERELDRRAGAATARRKELFNRDVIRDTFRRNMDPGASRPTMIPR